MAKTRRKTIRRRTPSSRGFSSPTSGDDLLPLALLIGGGVALWYYLKPKTATLPATFPTTAPAGSAPARRMELEVTDIRYGTQTPKTPARAPASSTQYLSPYPPGTNRTSAEYVRWVQSGLNFIMSVGLAVDGLYGPKTKAAVQSYQSGAGLTADGIVGPITEEVLSRHLQDKINRAGGATVYEDQWY